MKRGLLGLHWEPRHGLLGLGCLAAQALALAAPAAVQPPLVLVVICGTAALTYFSRGLLDRAPEKTVIMRGVVAPHRDAFRRTSAFVNYLNLRLCWQCGWWPGGSYAYVLSACAWNLYSFLPRRGWANGNTYSEWAVSQNPARLHAPRP